MSYTPNYVSSQNVSVFPSAFRRSDDSHKGSYLLTERNLGNLNSSSLDYESYVEDAGDNVVIVLGGYRFVVVRDALSAIRQENNSLFANIKISNTGNLWSFDDNTTLDVGGNFVGLYFGTTADEGATYSIEVLDTEGRVPEGSKLKMNTLSITSDGEHSIATELKTDKISANSGDTITLSSNVVAETDQTITANVSGNADSADRVNHTFTVNLNGGGNMSFNGSADVNLGDVFAPTKAGDSVNQLLGSSGSSTTPPDWISSNVGSATQSVYMKNGVITAGSPYAGGTRVELNDVDMGETFATIYAPYYSGQPGQYLMWARSESSPNNIPVWANTTIGNENTPIYQDYGVLKSCSKFAGGTAVTLNDKPKGADVAVFYAPTTAGTNGRLLKSNGNQPVWASDCSIIEDDGHGVECLSLKDGMNDGVMTVGWWQSHPVIEVDDNSTIEFNTRIQASSFNATSDSRLKDNIEEYKPSKSILDLGIKQFDLKSDGTHHIGCIAQDLREICPEIVHEDNDGYLSIEESKIVYLLLDEVRKLKNEVENLKKGR